MKGGTQGSRMILDRDSGFQGWMTGRANYTARKAALRKPEPPLIAWAELLKTIHASFIPGAKRVEGIRPSPPAQKSRASSVPKHGRTVTPHRLRFHGRPIVVPAECLECRNPESLNDRRITATAAQPSRIFA